MPRTSAGLLPFTTTKGATRVFLGRMGGPFWARRARAWTVVKGEHDPGADPRTEAEREFLEEVGAPVPQGPWTDLGEVRQSGGKVVRAWALETTEDLAFVASNTFEMEWPPRSGRRQAFPELEGAQWHDVDVARELVVAAQTVFLDRLLAHVDR